MSEESQQITGKSTYLPDPEIVQDTWIGDYEEAYAAYRADPEGFWAKVAQELHWYREWDSVLEWEHPHARWFSGARTNITYNCLDRHIFGNRRNKVALIWKGESDEDERIFTYRHLYIAVNKFANGLKKLGVQKGDRVCIYMPMVPEQIIAMLACARIGAVHTVVFGGFGSAALNARIVGAGAKVVVTADYSVRRGKSIPLKHLIEEAIINAPTVEHVVVYRRQTEQPIEIHREMEIDFYELMEGVDRRCPCEEMDAEDPLFILYTSGTAGTPKGIVHTCGGYMVGAYYTTKHVFDIRDNDVYWCTADPGWITGHTYVVYGPLMLGTTVLVAETLPDYPDPGNYWSILEEYGVNIFYTAPTAIRMFMKMGEKWPNQYDLSYLRVLGSVGEPLNPEAWEWFHRIVGKGRLPIVDTWWQTETGMHMVTTTVGSRMKPGFAGRPLPGVAADVVNSLGEPVPPGTAGFLVVREPWPSMMRGVFGNDEIYSKYWNTIDNLYKAGDLAIKDEEGYIMVIGRADDLIIVSGHNIGTAEVESALISHQAVAEAAVIGKPDSLKGNLIKAFVTLRVGHQPSDRLRNELVYHVRITLGPIAMPSEIEFMDSLPKTRSGKIMRRVLKARELGMDPGDLSSLDE
ncbi:Acetyl-coenzyme A synthetase [anaerobic digester metagenome]